MIIGQNEMTQVRSMMVKLYAKINDYFVRNGWCAVGRNNKL